MEKASRLLFVSIEEGFLEGLKVTFHIVVIMVPISLIVTILNYFNILFYFSNLISPYSKFLGIHGSSVFALLSGVLLNCYSALAIMANLPITIKEITILSAMILICHNLPLELSIQKKSGGSILLLFVIRVFSAILTGMVLNLLLVESGKAYLINTIAENQLVSATFTDLLKKWLFENIVIIKISGIMVSLMVFYKILKNFKIIDLIEYFLKHIMFIFGLSKKSAFIWIISNSIGLIIGAGILIDYNKNNILDDLELKRLNISIASCHALIQETSIFLVLGAILPFLIIPRIIISITTVWIFNLYAKFKY